MSYLAIWEFHVKPDSIPIFEKIYGPDGDWAQLFLRSAEYIGTKLIRDLNQPGRYLTLDCWTSRDALQRFKHDYQSGYSTLDKQCESLTEQERLIGEFETTRAA